MAAPTAPYTTQENVALLSKNVLRGATQYSANSELTDATVNQFIDWVSSSISMKFSEAGYKVPFVEYNGETWPTHQTEYLAFVANLGTLSMIYPALLPAPGMGPGQRTSGKSLFRELYDQELMRIYDGKISRLRFRADYYLGTPAELAISEPVGPKTNFSSGPFDKTRYVGFGDYTELIQSVAEQLNFDYTTLVGYGYNA